MNLANKGFLLLSILSVFLMLQACSSTDKNDSKRRRNKGGAQPLAQVDEQALDDDSLSTAENDDQWDVVLAVEGMMCPTGCAAPIQAELSSCTNVEACLVDFDTKVAYVKYNDASTFTTDSLVQIIGSVGPYSVTVKETF